MSYIVCTEVCPAKFQIVVFGDEVDIELTMGLDQNSTLECVKSLVMSKSNKYVRNSKISESRFIELLTYFAFELDTQTIELLTKPRRSTAS